ncbi:MAG: SurA N-terminal domain-containing protein, partial [Candidatus Methylomirabilales bacterium]
MLKRMRDHLKAIKLTLWLVIAAFIGTTFLVWGMRAPSDGGRGGMVATVGGEGISFEEY